MSNHVYPPIEVYLDSRNCVTTSDYHNDCSFVLNKPVICPVGYSIYMQVLSFTMPHCLTVVNAYNNHIVINNYDYTLDVGNYSIYQLVGVLTKLDPTVQCKFDTIRLKCTFTSKVPCTINGPLCALLGIIRGSSGLSVETAYTIDMSGINSIYMLTDLSCSNGNIDSRVGSDNVLCRVPVSVPPSSIIEYLDTNGRAGLLIDDQVVTNIRVVLEDEDRRPLLTTLSWQLCLQCRFIYTGQQSMAYERPLSLAVPPK